ncbi:hypothetical protein [Dyella sp.]|uniref:hypothetical protein n=1 Tax=Dyella sp. TaxID=1869338 RepID=UPI002ED58D95
MAWRQHPFWRTGGLLVLIWLLLNLPTLLAGRILPWDAIDQFYPTVYFNAHSLRHGIAPWWNPHIYAGYPQIADPQGMLFSPLLMAWMMIPSVPGANWFAWGVLLHVLLGGFGAYAFLRRQAANRFGGLVGAMVFMAGGVAASRLEHVPIVLAYSYAPWVLVAIRELAERPRWKSGLLLGLAAGIMLVHMVQLSYLLAWVALAYALATAVTRWKHYPARERRQWVMSAGLAALVAVAIVLPQLLLTFAFTMLSNRAELPLSASQTASLDARSFLTLLLPNALHALRGHYDGASSIVEAYLYLGALPSLMLLGLPGAWRQPRQRRHLMFFGGVALLAMLYMMGTHTPFYGWLYATLPGIKLFRRPADAAYLLNMAFAFAIGWSASYIDRASPRAIGTLLLIAFTWLLVSSAAMRGDGASWQPWTLAAALAALIAYGWLRWKPRDAARIGLVLLLITVVDYRCFNLNGHFNENSDTARAFLRNDTANRLAALLPPTEPLPPRIEPIDASVFWDNLVVLRGFESTQGYNPLRYALYDHWYGARDNGNLPRVATAFNTSPASALTRLLAVGYVVRNTDGRPEWTAPIGYERIFVGSHSEIWRNTRAYPRLLTPDHATLASAITPDDIDSNDYSSNVLLTPRDRTDDALAHQDQARCTASLHAVPIEATPTQLTVHTQSSTGPGWLVLSELDFPGWSAEANGTPLPIHRANGMFRAVCVPAGEQTVNFRFHPWEMVATAWRQSLRSR